MRRIARTASSRGSGGGEKKRSDEGESGDEDGRKLKGSYESSSDHDDHDDEELTEAERRSRRFKQRREKEEMEGVVRLSHRERVEQFSEKLGQVRRPGILRAADGVPINACRVLESRVG